MIRRRNRFVEQAGKWAVLCLAAATCLACAGRAAPVASPQVVPPESGRKSEPAAAEPESAADADSGSVPETSAPKPPEPEPAQPDEPPLSPRMSAEPDPEQVESIQSKLRRTRELLQRAEARGLSEAERAQVQSIRAFTNQAESALDAGEVERATVLVDKAFLLARDLAGDS